MAGNTFGFGSGGGFNFSHFDDDRGERFLARLLARKPTEDDEAEAHVRWGGPSNFLLTLRGGPKMIPVVEIINWPETPEGEEEEPIVIREWSEVPGTRESSEVRVENPDDPEQYVMVKRTERTIFRTDTGDFIRLNFVNEEEG